MMELVAVPEDTQEIRGMKDCGNFMTRDTEVDGLIHEAQTSRHVLWTR